MKNSGDDRARREGRESWLACALPALSDDAFDEVYVLVEKRLRGDIADRVGSVDNDPRDVIGDGPALECARSVERIVIRAWYGDHDDPDDLRAPELGGEA